MNQRAIRRRSASVMGVRFPGGMTRVTHTCWLIIAARARIVEGAVGMVEHALEMLAHKNIIELDNERKAAMVSNLLVVLCGHSVPQPVVNTGTIYQ